MFGFIAFLSLLAFIGVAILTVKLLALLIIVPIKLAFGLTKGLLGLVVGIPLAIIAVILCVVAIPVATVVIPVLCVVGLILCLVAAPFVLLFKLVF